MNSNNLTGKTTTGFFWSYLSTITNAAFQLGFAAVMARLLPPAVFGLFAMAQVVVSFGQYFTQMGLGSALIQKKEISNTDIRAAQMLVLLFGAVCVGVLWIISPWAAVFYKTPEVTLIIKVIAFTLLIQGFGSIPMALIRRRMDFKSHSIVEIISYVAGYGCTGVVCALNGQGVWSLVFASLTQGFLQAVISLVIVRCPVLPRWSVSSFKVLLSYGGRISIIGILEFLSSQIESILSGRFLGQALLGLYNRGQMLVGLPLYYFALSFGRVLFPALSRVKDEPERQREAFLKGYRIFAGFIIPLACAASCAAETLVMVVLGKNWTGAIQVVRIIAIAVMLNLLASPLAVLCEANALLNRKIVVQLIKLPVRIGAFFLLLQFGLTGVSFAVLSSEIVYLLLYMAVTAYVLGLLRTVRSLVPGICAGAVMALSITLVNFINLTIAFTMLFDIILFIAIMYVCFNIKLFSEIRCAFGEIIAMSFPSFARKYNSLFLKG
ncbi:MAG: lipopolysaccharide biosynthesis protein [Chitinispirillaceae bacterium]|nr:lipopolysaccharide biosynthesis protein [Chitinispirillaceae bacterium]